VWRSERINTGWGSPDIITNRGEDAGIIWYRDGLGFFSYEPRGYQILRLSVNGFMPAWELRCIRGGERSLGLFRKISLAQSVAEMDAVVERVNIWSGDQ
jgi:hypothetical protein